MKHSTWILGLIVLAMIAIPLVVSATDWPLVANDPEYSRNSSQTVIGPDNVARLQPVWVFNTNYPVEDPPLIVGDTAYIQNNAVQVFAVDLRTGLNKWKYDPNVTLPAGNLPRATSSHGIAYDNGVIYAPTGSNGTILALDAKTGRKIWETEPIDRGPAYRISSPPIFWNGIIVAGSALGDEPPFGVAQKGTVTGIDMATGKKLWQTYLAVGDWVSNSTNASQNGGATTWSGGAIDTDTGVVFLPIGNPSPDFKPEVRSPGPNDYSNHVIAVNITDGKILWSTPFIADGTVLPNVTTLPDGRDWDCSWGTNLIRTGVGNAQKVVIGHDKRGDVMAMDSLTGRPLWWITLTDLQNPDQNPSPNGTDVVIPGPGAGVEAFTATDGTKVYAAVSNTAGRYYNRQPSFLNGTNLLTEGGFVPDFSVFPNGYGNGSINAIDVQTGQLVWKTRTDNCTFVSPLVTNGLVFSGQLTDQGKPFEYSDFGGPSKTPLLAAGYLMALGADTGQELWRYNVGAQVGIGGPSIGNGYLLVPTGGIQETNNGGYVMAFAVPGTTPTGTLTPAPTTPEATGAIAVQTPVFATPPATYIPPANTTAAGTSTAASGTPTAAGATTAPTTAATTAGPLVPAAGMAAVVLAAFLLRRRQ